MVRSKETLVIIVSWNSKLELRKSLPKVIKMQGSFDVLVVDNDSVDDTREFLKNNFPTVKVMNSGGNLGYAGGNNVGFNYAIKHGYRYVFVVGPDVYVHNDCLVELLAALRKKKKVASASPKIYYSKPKNTIWYAGSWMDWNTGAAMIRGYREQDTGKYNKNESTDGIIGAAMLIRVEVLKKNGLLDERFFMYCEETDLSLRMKEAGYLNLYVPKALAVHNVSASSGGEGNAFQIYYYTRNTLLLVEKHNRTMIEKVKRHLLRTARTEMFEGLKHLKWGSISVGRARLKGIKDYNLQQLGRRHVK